MIAIIAFTASGYSYALEDVRMARYFLDEFVKWSYRVEMDDEDPSQEDLKDYDETLQLRYDPYLEEEMQSFGIDVSRRNKSIVAMLALSSSGSARIQVRRACEYWVNVRNVQIPA